MTAKLDGQTRKHLFEYLLRLGDDRLILGHRLSEWCGHAPILEEDIALTNMALDYLGQASALLHLAGKVEGKGRSEDDLAYFREVTEFKNLALVELPRGDFAYTIMRQFLFSVYSYYLFDSLQNDTFEELAGIAAKALKEVRYHVRHTREWVYRLGDGTEESYRRVQQALQDLWRYTGELFVTDDTEISLAAKGIAVDVSKMKAQWLATVDQVLREAKLAIPEDGFMVSRSRQGRHTEHLGHLLAEMQILARSFPNANW